jgi:hypothetical protein
METAHGNFAWRFAAGVVYTRGLQALFKSAVYKRGLQAPSTGAPFKRRQ